MTKLAILSTTERKQFDAPPTFSHNQQTIYFALNRDIQYMLDMLRTTTNKVGFLLQLGYFKSHGKFYATHQFKQQDIDYILNLLGLEQNQLNWKNYQKRILSEHRKKILTYCGWEPPDQDNLEHLHDFLQLHAKNIIAGKIKLRFLHIIK